MKINHLHTRDKYSLVSSSGKGRVQEQGKFPDLIVQNECVEKYKNKPAESINFSGFLRSDTAAGKAEKLVKQANKQIEKLKRKMAEAERPVSGGIKNMVKNKGFLNFLEVVKENEAIFEATIALGIGVLIKPIAVLAMPGAEDKDKQMVATKNALAAIIGYVLSNTVLTPIAMAVNKIVKDPEKHITNENILKRIKTEAATDGINYKEMIGSLEKIVKNPEQFVNEKNAVKRIATTAMENGNYTEAFNSLYKKALDVGVAPLKASLTIAMMPVIIKLIFGKQNEKADKKNKKDEPMPMHLEILNNPNFVNKKENEVFKDIMMKGGK